MRTEVGTTHVEFIGVFRVERLHGAVVAISSVVNAPFTVRQIFLKRQFLTHRQFSLNACLSDSHEASNMQIYTNALYRPLVNLDTKHPNMPFFRKATMHGPHTHCCGSQPTSWPFRYASMSAINLW